MPSHLPRRPSFRPALEALEGRATPALVIKPTLVPPRVLTTTEGGGAATFTVALSLRPLRVVTYFLKSDDVTEGQVNRTSVTFTPLNFKTPQAVKVTGQPDRLTDGDVRYHVIFSTSPRFLGRPAAAVDLINKDTGVHGGVAVRALTPLRTTEAGGMALFTVRLTAKPTAAVVIPVASSRPTEGLPKNAAGQVITRLTFTPANWDKVQTVTVQGVDDQADDGDQPYKIVLGRIGVNRLPAPTDPAYLGRDPLDVAVVNTDNDPDPAALRAFDGTYSGTYTGTATGTALGFPFSLPISGTYLFTVRNGVITLTAPASGTGTLQLNGDASFTISTDAVPNLTLLGTFAKGADGEIGGSGSFLGSATTDFGGASASGTWTVGRLTF